MSRKVSSVGPEKTSHRAISPSPEPPRQSTAEAASERYHAALDVLLNEARAGDTMQQLVEALTLTLAIIMFHSNQAATAEILRLIGQNILLLRKRERAEQEAEAAKQQGMKPS